MDLKKRVGRRLAELREMRGMSPHQLATAAKVTSRFIGRLESGDRASSFGVLESLAVALDVDPSDFFVAEGKTSKRTGGPTALEIVHLQGAASRLKPKDLELVLELVRRLGR